MNSTQKSIILVSIIKTILDEYDDGEKSKAITDLSFVCHRFMKAQSGTVLLPFGLNKVIDQKKHNNFIKTVMVGDKIWRKTVDRYASNGITIEAISLIDAVYSFDKESLAKHANITPKRIEALRADARDGQQEYKLNGTVIGGYITELLYKEMGQKINGRLRALKNKVVRELVA